MVDAREVVKLFKQFESLDVAVEDVLKNSDFITLDLLFNLQNVHICGELLDLTTTDGVDQASLTDTIPSDKTVLSALDEPELRVLQESLASDDDVDSRDSDVPLETFALVVAALRLRDALLVAHELGNLLIERVFGLSLRLGSLLSELTRLELAVLIGFAPIDASEGIQEVLVSHNVALLLHLVQDDRVRQLLSHNCVSLLNNDQLAVMKDLVGDFADLESGVIRIDHAICEEVSDEGVELGRVPRLVLLDQLGHILVRLIRQS